MSKNHHPPFYGKEVLRHREQEFINNILKKYKKLPATAELKEKIWNELQMEKNLGKITIPFKVVLRQDPYKMFPDMIEIILDSKV